MSQGCQEQGGARVHTCTALPERNKMQETHTGMPTDSPDQLAGGAPIVNAGFGHFPRRLISDLVGG
eukprot:5451407-Prymnesium_polylepis.3